MMKKYVYPAVIERNESTGRYIIVFPDFPELVNIGEDQKKAAKAAWGSLGICLYHMEDDKLQIPEPSDPLSMAKPAGTEILMIEVDMQEIRQALDKKTVYMRVSLPKWLRDMGLENNLNFSRTLRIALKRELGIVDNECSLMSTILPDFF